MTIHFEIIHVRYHHNRGQVIFARLLDSGLNFELKEDAIFGGIPVYNYLEMPRMLDENNQPRLDVFVFRPIKPNQQGDFVEGQKVELIIT